MHKTLDLQNKNRNGINNNKKSFSLVPKNFKVLFAQTCRCHPKHLTHVEIMKHQNTNPDSLIAGLNDVIGHP